MAFKTSKSKTSLEDVKAAAWIFGELRFLLHSSQKDVYDRLRELPPTVRQAVVLISRRWGKSFLGAVMAIETCLRKPKSQVFIVAPSLKHASAIVLPIIRELATQAPTGLFKHEKSALRWHFANGSTLVLGAFETAVESFRGLFATDIFLEESGLADAESFDYVLKSVLLPTLAHSRGRIVHLTTPSTVLDHPLHLEVIPKAKLENAYFEKTVYDNPLLTPETIEELKKEAGGENSIAWQREFLVKIIRDVNTSVIPEFLPELHVKESELPPYLYWTVAVDLGFSQDLSAAVLMYYDFLRAKVVVHDSKVWPRGTHTRTIVDDLKKLEEKWKVVKPSRYIDADARVRADIAAEHNYPLLDLLKDDRDAQINALKVAFAQNRIEAHPRCQHLNQTLESARWNKHRTDFERTETLGHADSLMALVYGFRMLNRANPYPAHHGLSIHTHHIPEENNKKKRHLSNALLPTF